MKNALNIFKFVIVLLCITFCNMMNACNPPATGLDKQNQVKALKMIDKNVLLSIVDDLSKSMSKNHNSVKEAIGVLKSYSSIYKINIGSVDKSFNSSKEYLSVRFVKDDRDTSKILFCTLSLPQPFYKQITFNDFKRKFGDWEKVPMNARPKEAPYVSTSFHNKDAPNIAIQIDSQKLPEYDNNSIEQIEIIPSML